MMDTPAKELLEPLPNGLSRVSNYSEFLKVTGEKDSGDMFIIWLQAAYTLMQLPAGNA
jgi:hypothetical protein